MDVNNTKDYKIVNDNATRTIMFCGDVTFKSMGELAGLIQFYSNAHLKDKDEKLKPDATPVKLHIMSYGGDVYAAFGAIEAIRKCPLDVHTYVNGMAMSAGLLLFLAGDKRYMSKYGTLMYHQMSCCRCEKYSDFLDEAEEIKRLQTMIEDYVNDRTNVTMEQLEKNRSDKTNWYIRLDEALSIGMVTKEWLCG